MVRTSLTIFAAFVATAAALRSSDRSIRLGADAHHHHATTDLKARFPNAQPATMGSIFQKTQQLHQGTMKQTARLFQVPLYEEDQEREVVAISSHEAANARLWFAGFLISTLLVVVATVGISKTVLVTDSSDSLRTMSDLSLFVRSLPKSDFVIPALTGAITMMTFLAVMGGAKLRNKKVIDPAIMYTAPGEASNVFYDRIDNFGERAFFASFCLVLQACLGMLACLAMRKYGGVQMSTEMVFKFACRGAAVGVVATMLIEFVHLPFQDSLTGNDNIVARIFVILFVVAGLAVLEEAAKMAALAVGLKREASDSEETGVMRYLSVVLETPRALALAGLASGVGFAFVENIPRLLAVATEPPMVAVYDGTFGSSEQTYISEADQRSIRVATLFIWVLLNIQPVLSGYAAFKVAERTGGAKIMSPVDWAIVLHVVVLVHFAHDLLARSTSSLVTFLSFLTVPYAIRLFYKEWQAHETGNQGLLGSQA